MDEKRNVGRPALVWSQKERNKITVYMTDALFVILRTNAKMQGISMSDEIKNAIRKHFYILGDKYEKLGREPEFDAELVRQRLKLEEKWQRKANKGGNNDT